MSKLDDKVGTYAEAVRSKCGVEPDMGLLRKVARGLGPVIYSADAETVAATDKEEIARIKRNFLVKKLGLAIGRPRRRDRAGDRAPTGAASGRSTGR